MEYTKGEWKARIPPGSNGYWQITCGKTGTEIGILYPSTEEIEANAHLIAAAPNMYEALKELCNILGASCSMDYLKKHNLMLPLSRGEKALAEADMGAILP